jgi:hypothetical protein
MTNTLNNIATLAAKDRVFNNGKKPTKPAVYGLVEELIASGLAPTEYQLATLYGYFIPALPAKPKTAAQWVQKAVPSKDVRYYLNNANVLAGKLRGTDGHRLHIAPTDLVDGYYDKAGNLVEVDGRYPDIDRVIPNGPNRIEVKFNAITDFYTGVHKYNTQTTEVLILREAITNDDGVATQTACEVNKKYFQDAISNPSPVARLTLPPLTGTGESVLIEFADGSLAVVMPLRQPKK